MSPIQIWLVRTLERETPVSAFMQTAWGWPAMESLHFIGLALLLGPIVMFDLRLLGMGRSIPIKALHSLVPWGIGGFSLTVVTGTMFLMTEPNQYIYNPSFHLKMVFLGIAGLNASAFYAFSARRTFAGDASGRAPRLARLIALLSLTLWMGIVVSGRLITFYRPGDCGADGPGFVADCIP